MNILPTDSVFNIAVLVLVILLLFGFALLLAAIHSFLSKWLGLLQTEKTSGSTEVLNSARIESQKLIQEANERAQAIIAGAGDMSEDTKKSINKALQELTAKHEAVLKKELEEQKDIGLHTIQQATKTIQEGVLDEVSQFEDIVHKETIESGKLVEERINKEYETVKGELEKYREEEMTRINESIFNVLKEVSTKVLGHALSMEEHRDLVLGALDEAKRRNLFEEKHDDVRK